MKRQIFGAEHDAFRETVRTFLAKEVTPYYDVETDGIVWREAWRAGRRGCSASPYRRSAEAAATPTSATAPYSPRSSRARGPPVSPSGCTTTSSGRI